MEVISFLSLALGCHFAVMFLIGPGRILISWEFMVDAPIEEIIRRLAYDEVDLESAIKMHRALTQLFVQEWQNAHRHHFMGGMFSFDGPVKYLGLSRKPTADEVLERAMSEYSTSQLPED